MKVLAFFNDLIDDVVDDLLGDFFRRIFVVVVEIVALSHRVRNWIISLEPDLFVPVRTVLEVVSIMNKDFFSGLDVVRGQQAGNDSKSAKKALKISNKLMKRRRVYLGWLKAMNSAFGRKE